jgi:hypothetical protein
MNNLLKMALSIIPRVQFQVKRFASQVPNDIGLTVPTYAAPVTVWGCVQAVDNSAYQQLGLEFGKNYIAVWAEIAMLGIDKQEVSDQIIYDSKTFNVVTSTDWMNYNGWSSIIAVESKE